MSRKAVILWLVGGLAGVVGLVCFDPTHADPGEAMIRALDEAGLTPLEAGVSVKELVHTDPQNPSQNKEWMPICIFGQEMRIPRGAEGINVSDLSSRTPTRAVSIFGPSFGFTRFFEAEPEKNDVERGTLFEMGPGTKKFKLIVSALIDAGESPVAARKIVYDARDALMALSSEDIFVRHLGCDKDSLAKELQPEKAAEEGLLALGRANEPDRAFRFKAGKETVYAVHLSDLSHPKRSSWAIRAYNRKGQATWWGRYWVDLPSKLKNELDALKRILIVGDEDSKEPQGEALTKPRPTTQSVKE